MGRGEPPPLPNRMDVESRDNPALETGGNATPSCGGLRGKREGTAGQTGLAIRALNARAKLRQDFHSTLPPLTGHKQRSLKQVFSLAGSRAGKGNAGPELRERDTLHLQTSYHGGGRSPPR